MEAKTEMILTFRHCLATDYAQFVWTRISYEGVNYIILSDRYAEVEWIGLEGGEYHRRYGRKAWRTAIKYI